MQEFRPSIDELAELIVGFAANVQPGQVVSVLSEPGKEAVTRAVAESAYRRGARFVDVWYFDYYVKRARLAHAAENTLEYVPPWYGERLLALGREQAARIALAGLAAPHALDGLDPARAGRDRLPILKELVTVVNERSTNWTAAPAPTGPWAELVHPELEPEAAYARLWDEIVHVCRLDEPDPATAWRTRMRELVATAERLTARRFDALHFEGPGTDLTIGLLPSSSWQAAEFTRADGLRHLVNVPSEEVFTTPDPERVDGFVRATLPLEYVGSIIRGIEVRFEAGRAVSIEAESGAGVLRTAAAGDEGASRLGEVALVDRRGRVGPLGTIFYDTLLDENAASHIALGQAYTFAVADSDKRRVNESHIHIDFMIGSDDVAVTGLTRDCGRVPVLYGGEWQV
ncbi:MAG: aminopeptidase [Thermoleophilia bacterium]|nr:aminopeptidase [Thermoleophilia bacterium]